MCGAPCRHMPPCVTLVAQWATGCVLFHCRIVYVCVCSVAHALFPPIQHTRRIRRVPQVEHCPMALHQLDSGGAREDPCYPAELAGRPHCRSSEGETHACKYCPSQSVAVRCTHSHIALCTSRTTVRICHCARATPPFVCVCIYIYMYVCIYTTVESSGAQAANDGTGAPPPQPSQPRAASAPTVRLYAHNITTRSCICPLHITPRPFVYLPIHIYDHMSSCDEFHIAHCGLPRCTDQCLSLIHISEPTRPY